MNDIDYATLSISELDALIQGAQTARSKKVETRRTELLAELAALDGEPLMTRAPKKSGNILFKDSQGNTWSGRGRVPQWVKDYEAAGRNRSEFKV
jgi:DNA-binding protein H-NS